ncbi:hypothetical protein MJD09_09035 [bacterium]|nr:hypothetical protein [bacterium]
MKGEMFVINAIDSSDHAQSVADEHVPADSRYDLFKTLRRMDRLVQAARGLRVNESDFFQFLANRIIAALNRSPVSQLTCEHLKMLKLADVRIELAKLFGCPPRAVLNKLLDIHALQATLQDFGPAISRRLEAEGNAINLLNELLRKVVMQELEFEYVATKNDWQPIVEGEQWLSEDATRLLLAFDPSEDAKSPYRGLATLVDRVLMEQDDPDEFNLLERAIIGPLGLIHIRRRMSWIISRLYDQAIENLDNVVRYMPSSPSLQLLKPLLYTYELGAIAKGLQAYLGYEPTLRELLHRSHLVKVKLEELEINSGLDEESVIPDETLTMEIVKRYKIKQDGIKKEVGHIQVKCMTEDQDNAQLILGANDVPRWVYEQLEKKIPNLTPSDLSTVGDAVHEKLLNTSFSIFVPQVELLKDLISKLGSQSGQADDTETSTQSDTNELEEPERLFLTGDEKWTLPPEFVQAVALSCDQLIEQLPELWNESFAQNLPYHDLPSAKDPMYSLEVDDLIEQHRETYPSAINLRIIRGELNIFQPQDPAEGSEEKNE